PGLEGIDWAIISGTLGSDNGSIVPSEWTAGSTTLNVRFINPGTYSMKLRTGGSNQCGLDSITKTICVNPLPKVNFSMASDTLCSSAIDSVIYSPATEYCGKNIYNWFVSYSSVTGCFPGVKNYIYIDGTDSLSAKPHFKFLNPGIYTIQLTAYSPGRSCVDIAQKEVVVKGVPFISLSANGGVCQNQPISFTNTVSCFIGNATYNWMFPGSNTSSSNLAVPPPVIYSNTGNYNVSLTVTNECGTSAGVERLIVDTIVMAKAGPDTTFCGNSITMAANAPGAANGVWSTISGPNVPSITTPASPSTTITGLVPGVYVFKWKIFNGGCADSSNVTITIAAGPSVANAGPDQLLCRDTAATFAGNTPTRGAGKWSFISGPNTPVITDIASPASGVTGLKPGTYIFTWTINFSNCDPSIDTVQIKINDNPTVANAGNDQTICSSSTALTGNNPAIGTGEWSLLNGPNSPVITSPTNASTSVTGMISGTYSFVWKISNDPCPASSDTVLINVSTIANNVISKDQSICINTAPAAITGSVPAGGNGNYNYQWQQSTDSGIVWNNIDTAVSVDYIPGILANSSCYRRIVKTSLCPTGDTSNRVCVTVNPDAKALFAASNTVLCAPANVDSFITLTTFPDRNLQYNWYQNNTLINGTVNGFPPSFIITNPGENVVIKLITTSPYGCKADSMNILFKTIPSVTAKFTKDAASGCGPLAVNFTNTSTILDNSVAFFWDFGNGAPISNSIQPAPVVFEASPTFADTTYYITLKAFSGCDTSVMKDSVKVFANPKARFTSTATGCSPFRDTIVNNSFGMDASTRYYWDFGDNTKDTTLTSGNVYHTYNTGVVDTFTIRLIAENRCGRDTQFNNVVVSPNTIQPRFSINGNELYGCAPHSITFQNSSLGASLLTFDFGDGSSPVIIPNTQPDITHTYTSPGDYTVRIKLQNSCTDTTALQNVSVYAAPLASFNLTKSLFCDGETFVTNNTSSNANSYQWLWGDGNSTSAFNASHAYANPGVYQVRLVASKVNAFGTVCTDTASSVSVTVVERIPAIVTIDSGHACVPYTIKVSADGAANAGKVDWYFYDGSVPPGIFHVSGRDASYTYLNDGAYSVKLVVTNTAGCSDSIVKQFAVYKTPTLDFTPVNLKTCNTDTSITFNVTPNYNGTDPLMYEWYINDQITGNSNPFIYRFQSTSGITAVNPFSIKVLAKNTVGCGDTSFVGNVIIQTLARQYISVAPSIVQEQPHYTFTFTDSAEGLPNSTYLWKTGDRSGQELPGKQINYTYGDTGTFHVNLLVQDYETGCFQTDSVTVYVLAVPGYLYVPNAFCPGCQKAELRQFLPLGKGLKDYRLVIFNIWGQKVFETTGLDANGVPNVSWNGNWV
ncbi:MAG: PKD domain-containing protein, partial [Bacteroidota bacterium]|nr:PKD domain-containing protein [Bacteroidota bacterium]